MVVVCSLNSGNSYLFPDILPRMPRLARIVVPGRAHRLTQRGNRREAIFFEDGDQAIYLDLLHEQPGLR